MVYPSYISFPDWAMSLMIYFPNGDINLFPRNQSEDGWKVWGKNLASSKYFSNFGVPLPKNEKTWQEWAVKVFLVLSNVRSTNNIKLLAEGLEK